MHNGGIADFPLIKRKLQAGLTDEVFNVVQGNTGDFLAQFVKTIDLISYRCHERFRMGLRTISVEGVSNFMIQPLSNSFNFQLPESSAKSFTSNTLKQAMLETISSLNEFAEDTDITEVGRITLNQFWC
jgi:glutamine amidotransferase